MGLKRPTLKSAAYAVIATRKGDQDDISTQDQVPEPPLEDNSRANGQQPIQHSNYVPDAAAQYYGNQYPVQYNPQTPFYPPQPPHSPPSSLYGSPPPQPLPHGFQAPPPPNDYSSPPAAPDYSYSQQQNYNQYRPPCQPPYSPPQQAPQQYYPLPQGHYPAPPPTVSPPPNPAILATNSSSSPGGYSTYSGHSGSSEPFVPQMGPRADTYQGPQSSPPPMPRSYTEPVERCRNCNGHLRLDGSCMSCYR